MNAIFLNSAPYGHRLDGTFSGAGSAAQRIFLFLCVLVLTLSRPSGAAPPEVVVASYNVQNYLGENRETAGSRPANAKSKESVAALVQVIKEINPDILGICEMGPLKQFEEFKAQLAAAGLEYSHSEFVQGIDTDRHLALLSRFPIVARRSKPDISYELNGMPEKVKRGFLDVTIDVNPAYTLRLVGAHLKSKLASTMGEALMRRFEAHLLRKHLDEILSANPEENLLAYGDFNETKNEAAIQEIMGPRGDANHMTDLPAIDENGHRWTYYWRAADQYSRIDYFFASPALLPEVLKAKSRVNSSPLWEQASDHRAIYTSIVPVNRKR